MFVEFLAPFLPDQTNSKYLYAPPQPLHFVDDQGNWGLYVYGYTSKIDPIALRRTFEIDSSVKLPVGFFVEGVPYKLFNVIPGNRHLLAPLDPTQPMYLLGADRLGRDVFSRLIVGTRVSMSIGLIGVLKSVLEMIEYQQSKTPAIF